MGKAGHCPRHSAKRQLLLSTPGKECSNSDETSFSSLTETSLNFYVKITQPLPIGLSLFKNTVEIQ